jgi:hypothetical protein
MARVRGQQAAVLHWQRAAALRGHGWGWVGSAMVFHGKHAAVVALRGLGGALRAAATLHGSLRRCFPSIPLGRRCALVEKGSYVQDL